MSTFYKEYRTHKGFGFEKRNAKEYKKNGEQKKINISKSVSVLEYLGSPLIPPKSRVNDICSYQLKIRHSTEPTNPEFNSSLID